MRSLFHDDKLIYVMMRNVNLLKMLAEIETIDDQNIVNLMIAAEKDHIIYP